jgi:hypothetical protein
MIGLKLFTVAAIISMGVVTSASAQLPDWAISHPDAFQAQYPDRDVLKGGALTPAGRMGLELPGGAAPVFGPSRVYRSSDADNRMLHRVQPATRNAAGARRRGG